jgi:hypothetical protein
MALNENNDLDSRHSPALTGANRNLLATNIG